MSLLYLFLALLGLGFLVFIHELGHLIAARYSGMSVELFSIGFGPVLKRWKRWGITWQLSLFPCGGYLRIAGMEQKEGVDPYQLPGGFYQKSAWKRIAVACAGPLANIGFSFLVFFIIWSLGGQEKPFQQYTKVIGHLDSHSTLYQKGVRPGDQLLSINGRSINGYQELLISLLTNNKAAIVEGVEIDYLSRKEKPFKISLPAVTTTRSIEQIGATSAQYLIFNDFSSLDSPLQGSGIQKGDRILWANGEPLFSYQQLSFLLNEQKTILTIERKGKQILARIDRLQLSDLKLGIDQRNEISDWQHEAALQGKVQQLYFVPYAITHDNIVFEKLSLVSGDLPSREARNSLETVLHPGDQIIAVDGVFVENSVELLSRLQERSALIIVDREKTVSTSWKEADPIFSAPFYDLDPLIATIGSKERCPSYKNLILLPPISLKPLSELKLDPLKAARIEAEYQEKRRMISKIDSPQEREQQLLLLDQSQKRLMLGAKLNDLPSRYNPAPSQLFSEAVGQIWITFSHLFSGSLSPKSLSGPIGILQLLQYSWSNGVKEAFFWLGFVSLNLSLLNLLPIPLLDGGHILFAIAELIRGKRIELKLIEKLIAPFVIILVGLFIYLTYQDISRIIARWF